ncbi:class I SAM-dependent methyltransferase [Actinoplanes bogorensis]|uniref:Class I SAM-dependent methyltransferase n=1 Tax=Paractinoplanes bogorensis TaxID=1610840 RepID=A0ABS5YGV2_9ACTN|nr:class I SAM-dependent methyltransferase [Actinoplanes bogorensis]MBU2662651.1 class I SAM-dependent methyltransferase [Actinoplanes bogorensis]
MDDRNPARVFGEVAEDYDRVRPPYPEALIDDVLAYGEPGRRALEVGAGTGRATEALAARGVPVVAVEPDAAMADVLARRVARFPDVEVVRSSFEEFRATERFGLLFSAEAWHWTRTETRWASAAAALGAGGTLAIWWNTERIADPELRTALLGVFARHAPSVVVNDQPRAPELVWKQWPGDQLSEVAEFGDRASRHYRRPLAMPAADYLGLTRTRSQYRMLPRETRRELLTALTDLFDDEVPLDVYSTLLLARRRDW